MQSRVSVTIGYLSVRLSIPPFGCCAPLWWVCRCGCSWQEIVIAAWLSGWVLVWLSVWSEVQTCISSSWCHCHSLSLASVKRVWVGVGVCTAAWPALHSAATASSVTLSAEIGSRKQTCYLCCRLTKVMFWPWLVIIDGIKLKKWVNFLERVDKILQG